MPHLCGSEVQVHDGIVGQRQASSQAQRRDVYGLSWDRLQHACRALMSTASMGACWQVLLSRCQLAQSSRRWSHTHRETLSQYTRQAQVAGFDLRATSVGRWQPSQESCGVCQAPPSALQAWLVACIR